MRWRSQGSVLTVPGQEAPSRPDPWLAPIRVPPRSRPSVSRWAACRVSRTSRKALWPIYVRTLCARSARTAGNERTIGPWRRGRARRPCPSTANQMISNTFKIAPPHQADDCVPLTARCNLDTDQIPSAEMPVGGGVELAMFGHWFRPPLLRHRFTTPAVQASCCMSGSRGRPCGPRELPQRPGRSPLPELRYRSILAVPARDRCRKGKG